MRYDHCMAHFTDAQKAQLRERGISEDEANRQLALHRRAAGACRPRAAVPAGGRDRDDSGRAPRGADPPPRRGGAAGALLEVRPGVRGGDAHVPRRADRARRRRALLEGIERFAFVDDLRAELAFRGYDLDVLRGAGSGAEVVDALLGADGLGYATIPKGSSRFTATPTARGPRSRSTSSRPRATCATPSACAACTSPFRRSTSTRSASCAERVVPAYEQSLYARFELAFSVQKASTDTIAGTPSGRPFVADDGALGPPPVGPRRAPRESRRAFGATSSSSRTSTTCRPDANRGDTLRWKKILGGRLVELQRAVFLHVARLRSRPVGPGVRRGGGGRSRGRRSGVEAQGDALLRLLERPLRVCGVVRNTGEPGGGPYWVRGRDGRITRQIVETAQVDRALGAPAGGGSASDALQSGRSGRAASCDVSGARVRPARFRRPAGRHRHDEELTRAASFWRSSARGCGTAPWPSGSRCSSRCRSRRSRR